MAMVSSFDGPVALVTDMPICAVHREPGGDRIGPSSQPNGSLKNDSGKANGGGGIGVAAPAQSIAYPPLSPWPWVPRVRFTPRGASAGPGPPRLPGPPCGRALPAVPPPCSEPIPGRFRNVCPVTTGKHGLRPGLA